MLQGRSLRATREEDALEKPVNKKPVSLVWWESCSGFIWNGKVTNGNFADIGEHKGKINWNDFQLNYLFRVNSLNNISDVKYISPMAYLLSITSVLYCRQLVEQVAVSLNSEKQNIDFFVR